MTTENKNTLACWVIIIFTCVGLLLITKFTISVTHRDIRKALEIENKQLREENKYLHGAVKALHEKTELLLENKILEQHNYLTPTY